MVLWLTHTHTFTKTHVKNYFCPVCRQDEQQEKYLEEGRITDPARCSSSTLTSFEDSHGFSHTHTCAHCHAHGVCCGVCQWGPRLYQRLYLPTQLLLKGPLPAQELDTTEREWTWKSREWTASRPAVTFTPLLWHRLNSDEEPGACEDSWAKANCLLWWVMKGGYGRDVRTCVHHGAITQSNAAFNTLRERAHVHVQSWAVAQTATATADSVCSVTCSQLSR